jgi:beta-glucosidase
VGENAMKRMSIGGGSSSLKAKYEVSPLADIQAHRVKCMIINYE